MCSAMPECKLDRSYFVFDLVTGLPAGRAFRPADVRGKPEKQSRNFGIAQTLTPSTCGTDFAGEWGYLKPKP